VYTKFSPGARGGVQGHQGVVPESRRKVQDRPRCPGPLRDVDLSIRAPQLVPGPLRDVHVPHRAPQIALEPSVTFIYPTGCSQPVTLATHKYIL
jgi:hypothetical protein